MKNPTKVSKARARVLAWCEVHEEELVLLEGPEYDVAILGIVTGKGMPARVLYSTEKILELLKKEGLKEGLHEDEAVERAIEWFTTNTADAYVGEHTPCFLEDAWDGM